MIVPEAAVDNGHQDNEYRKPHGVFFHVHHVVAQDYFQSCGREFTDEAAQGVLPEVHTGKGRNGGNEAIGHVRDGPGSGDGLPGVVGVQPLQGFTFIDYIHGHAPEKGTHDIEGNKNSHCFREPGDDDSPEEAKYEAIGGGNKDRGQESYDIDDHVDEETHEGRINTKAMEIVYGPPEVPIF